MVEVTDDVLFAGLGSLVVELTVAVFVAYVVELKVDAVASIVIVTSPPTLSEPSVQLTVPALWVHVPWVVETDVSVTSVGSGSETVTFWATAGPLFVTCNV